MLKKISFLFFLIFFTSTKFQNISKDECSIFTEGRCKSTEIDIPPSFSIRNFQTPIKNSPKYQKSFQSFSNLKGWINIIYSSNHKTATVTVKYQINYKETPGDVICVFDGIKNSNCVKVFNEDYKKVLEIEIIDLKRNYKIGLSDVDFLWNLIEIKERKGDFRDGQKGAIVEFFGWKDKDIERECEMLSKAGFLGAKLFPHHEQLMSWEPYNNELNPWYFFYQPVSYKLEGRMGSRKELRKLIKTCRSLGIRVYADSVVNHMTGGGNDCQWNHRNDNSGNCIYWGGKNTSDFDNQSPFFNQGFCYLENENTKLPPSQEYPAVPYGPLDFHCERPLNSWTSPLELNAGWLVGLADLHTGKDHVRERIADYWIDLLGIGFSGFRIDAFKHIQPDDMVEIVKKFYRNLGGNFPKDFFFFGELLVGGEHDMLLCDEKSGYNFGKFNFYLKKGKYLENKFKEAKFTDDDILKLKLWSSWYPKEPEADCDKVDRRREVIQNDDHDQQNTGSSSRDMGDKGTVLVIAKDIPLHRSFEKKLFSDPFGCRDNKNEWPIRNILSSYWFTAPSGSMAPPDGLSDCKLCKINCDNCKTVEFVSAFNNSACAYEGSSGKNSGYTLVHRDREIILEMRKWMGLPVNVTNKEIGIPDRC